MGDFCEATHKHLVSGNKDDHKIFKAECGLRWNGKTSFIF